MQKDRWLWNVFIVAQLVLITHGVMRMMRRKQKMMLAFNSAIALETSGGDVSKIVAENSVLKSSLADLLEERAELIGKRDKGRPTKAEQYAGPEVIKRLIDFFRIPNNS